MLALPNVIALLKHECLHNHILMAKNHPAHKNIIPPIKSRVIIQNFSVTDYSTCTYYSSWSLLVEYKDTIVRLYISELPLIYHLAVSYVMVIAMRLGKLHLWGLSGCAWIPDCSYFTLYVLGVYSIGLYRVI